MYCLHVPIVMLQNFAEFQVDSEILEEFLDSSGNFAHYDVFGLTIGRFAKTIMCSTGVQAVVIQRREMQLASQLSVGKTSKTSKTIMS